ncbi:probable G-protein coupled receptor Mth-like 1 [Anabrus simplex]|uniref:probable G-protein coupled receptor Mth-like 1 n=1 Tax=Anabrus simplex TaxID=316456 RepID=UPI0035A36BF7
MFQLIILFVVTLILTALCMTDNNTVTVLKCCPRGEALALAVGDSTTCQPFSGEAIDDWIPFIYSPSRRVLSTEKTLPPNWTVKEASIPTCRNSVGVTVVTSHPANSPSFLLFDNGSIWLQEYVEVLDPGTFCVDHTVALVCLYDYAIATPVNNTGTDNNIPKNSDTGAPKKKVRIKKCCGDQAAYSETTSACIALPHNASFVAPSLASILPPGLLDNVTTVLSTGFPNCPGDELVIGGKLGDRDTSLKADGSLLFEKAGATLKPGDFCLEHVVEHLEDNANVFTCHSRLNAGLRNGRRVGDRESDIRFTLYPVGLILSVFFLAVTLITGCLLPGQHHVLHWRCQTSYVASLLIGDLLLAATQLTGDAQPSALCITVAVVMHYFFLSAFFWLNTMCFNIWWTFRDLRPASLDKSQEVYRMRFYGVYAWGCPFIIAGIAALIDNLPAEGYPSLIRPRFGHQRCWFYGDAEIFSYFFGPVGILMVVNLVLFAATARELTCGLWKREVVKSSTERTTLGRICLKLVVVMGLTWIADVISWAVGGPNYLWYFTDLINALQGVFIFAVVGCQPQVWAAVNRLWCWRVQQTGTTNMGHHLSSCSQGFPSLGDSTANSPSTKNVPLETMC